MNGSDALKLLCRHFGISTSYTDIHGREQQAPEESCRALLAAMSGASLAGAAEPEILAAAVNRQWRRILPPVQLVRENDHEVRLEFFLPIQKAEESVQWLLREEGGQIQQGTIRPADLKVEESRHFDDRDWALRRLTVPRPTASGYHSLRLIAEKTGESLAAMTLIATPGRCYQPETVRDGNRSWGLATQLYAVRSARNWGIGDFTDLIRLLEQAAEAGAGTVALTPLHALFAEDPERCNPYGPASRLFLNFLHIDLEAVPDYAESAEARAFTAADDFQARLRAVRAAASVDYAAVAALKLQVLALLFRHFQARHLDAGGARAQGFRSFCEEGGEQLRRFAIFQALSEHFSATAAAPRGWPDWPPAYQHPDTDEVAAFAAANRQRVDFFTWVQWLAHQQLAAAGRRSWDLRLGIGLCLDLAVGAAQDGAEVWSAPELYFREFGIGAPPDEFSPKGQNWKLAAWRPGPLREAAYQPFRALLRANMRDAGALRLDHVMGLMRLFLTPAGQEPTAGLYLSYVMEELFGVLALESLRNRCLVIGEDLGTVPAEVRAALATFGVLSCRLLYFERGEHGFLPPAEFEPQAVVSTGTHDLPTLAGFWQGVDLEQRRTHELFIDQDDYQESLLKRANDRAYLFLALHSQDLLPEGIDIDPVGVPALDAELIRAVYTYLARTPSSLLLIQTTDLLGQLEQVNLPGSLSAYPNWRHRQPLEIAAWPTDPEIMALLAAVREIRGVSERLPAEAAPEFSALTGVIPRATYRLQLHKDFGFSAATELIPYLDRLGISHCYFSPYLMASPGSTHGYDVVRHDRLNPELGTAEEFDHLCAVLADHGMGQILDMVPNHVGIMGHENTWWLGVLENGAASLYADYFDIDWEPLKKELRGKVLLPVLGDQYGNILDRGELKLIFDEGAFLVQYYDHTFPVDPREYPQILAPGLERLRERLGEDNQELAVFASLITAFANLPARSSLDEEAVAARHRDKEVHKQRLAELCRQHIDLDWYVRESLCEYNGSDDYVADTNRFHLLLEAQAYRLCYWRVAAEEINYRRFFDINELAALRMENPQTFEATHAFVLRLIQEGKVSGLRIDHPDGLYDPAAYCRELQARVAPAAGGEEGTAAKPLYLLVEKILAGDEELPADWPVHGTTGYDFAILAGALLVDPGGLSELNACYNEFVGGYRPFATEVYLAKKLVMRNLLSSELNVLGSELARIAESDPHTRDYTFGALSSALLEIVACFPVYRTYITELQCPVDHCAQVIRRAVAAARKQSHGPDLSVFDFVGAVLFTDIAEGKTKSYRQRILNFAMQFQQYSAPVMAKGLEDTAFYRFHRLISLNEVGGDPEQFGISLAAFHQANQRRLANWPHSMLAGTTHDSKRSEDVRARLHLLSELPAEWRQHVQRWTRLNRRHRRDTENGPLPEANTEYLFYQTLLGAWPLVTPEAGPGAEFTARMLGYMSKAVKEAKVQTSWMNPDPDYEAALADFVNRVLEPERNRLFFEDFLPFQRRLARLGLFNSLSQTLLRLTAPGVPDTYQGNELWDFSLVDPDNRRPVDYARRRALLDQLREQFPLEVDLSDRLGDLNDNLVDGRAKLYLIWRTLWLRRQQPLLFEQGDYQPLTVEGPHGQRLCAFARALQGRFVVVLAPRLLAGLGSQQTPFADQGWRQTFIEMPVGELQNILTGEKLRAEGNDKRGWRLPASTVLDRFAVGLLLGEA